MARRRHALIMIGVLHAGMGINLLTRTGGAAPDPALAILHELLLPVPLRVALWCIIAAAAIITGSTGRGERLGWPLAILMPAERAVSYAWSGLMWVIPGWPPGAVGSWAASLHWLVIGLLIWLIASWPVTPPPAAPEGV